MPALNAGIERSQSSDEAGRALRRGRPIPLCSIRIGADHLATGSRGECLPYANFAAAVQVRVRQLSSRRVMKAHGVIAGRTPILTVRYSATS